MHATNLEVRERVNSNPRLENSIIQSMHGNEDYSQDKLVVQ